MRIKRFAAASGAAVLLALFTSACGGDDASDAPADASERDFCEAFSADADASNEDMVDAAHKQADEMIKVGTPEGMSDEEREGFEIFVNALGDVGEDDAEAWENAEGEEEYKAAIGASDEEFEKVRALLIYSHATCAEAE